MLAQNVTVPVEQYGYFGGNERSGSKGGYFNYSVRFPELWKSESVQRWLRKKQPTTRAEYLLRFEKFFLWAANTIDVRTPEQFLSWARKEPDGTGVQDLIDQYAETLTKSNAHISTSLLRSFLGRNGYRDLPKIDWESTVSFTEGYTRAQIQTLLGYLPQPIHKLYVLADKDSGLRANDLLFLRYRHIREDLEKGEKYVHIRFEKERYLRKKAPGRTFLGPNSLNPLNQLIKDGMIRPDPDAQIFPFSYRNIAKVIGRAKRDAKLDPKIQPNHGLRKFFENCLDRVGMDHHKKMQLEGHSSGVRAAYTSREVEELRGLYDQAYRYLDLTEEGAVQGEVGELRKQVADLAADNKTLKDQLREALDMRKELDALKRKVEKG